MYCNAIAEKRFQVLKRTEAWQRLEIERALLLFSCPACCYLDCRNNALITLQQLVRSAATSQEPSILCVIDCRIMRRSSGHLHHSDPRACAAELFGVPATLPCTVYCYPIQRAAGHKAIATKIYRALNRK